MLWLSLALNIYTPTVLAADEEEDTFLEEGDSDKGKKEKSKASKGEGQVREITRGFYAKSDVGGNFYLLNFAAVSPTAGIPYVSSGTYVALSLGQDFVDQEKLSMAWEVSLEQGLNNGADADSQGRDGCAAVGGAAPCTEGDLRTYSLHAIYEISAYPSRRLGVGGRVGGGVLYSPLLIYPEAYTTQVIPDSYDGVDPGMHNSPKPFVSIGPTVEYYTKLSHFSVGLDVDAFYGIGWDLGVNAAGYLKYTF